jgi:ABC-type uncharacterized transport system permease subunit
MMNLTVLRWIIFFVAGVFYGIVTAEYGLFFRMWQWWAGMLIMCPVLSILLNLLQIK